MYAVCDNMIDIRRASFPISNLPSSSSSFTSSNHIFCTMQFTFIQLLVTTSSDITFFTRIKSGATAAVSRMNETKKHLAILNKRTRHKYMYILNIFLFLLSVIPSVGKNKKKNKINIKRTSRTSNMRFKSGCLCFFYRRQRISNSWWNGQQMFNTTPSW